MYPIILATSYLPPIQYISKFLPGKPVYIEKFENFQKQSYRNRCYIYGANGRQCLVIPTRKLHGEKTPIAGVEIDYSMHWQKIHLKSIESAYRLSAFYEFYADDIRDIYRTEIPLLFDWNMTLLNRTLSVLGIDNKPLVTENWTEKKEGEDDFRQSISPKKRLEKPDKQFNPLPYQQVFQDRYGFIPNLSIIDLIFNEGALSLDLLRRSIHKTSSVEKR